MSVTLAAVDIGASLQKGLDSFFAFLPKLIGFLIVLAIGYIVAKVVKKLVVTLLEKVGLDKAMHSGSVGEYVNKAAPDFSPSKLIGAIAFWFIFLGAISIAVSQLGIPALNTFVASIAAYLPNVDRRAADLRGRRRGRRGHRRSRRPHDGRHPDRQDRRLGRPRAGDGDRDVHDPQPAPDRPGDRDDHLRRADRRRVPGDGARLRARRPRGRRPDARRRLRQGPREQGPGQGRHAHRQGPRPAATPRPSRTRRRTAPATPTALPSSPRRLTARSSPQLVRSSLGRPGELPSYPRTLRWHRTTITRASRSRRARC